MLTRHHDRRGTKPILREEAGNTRAVIQPHHQQILAAGLADIRFGNAQRDTVYRQQCIGMRGG